MLNPQDKFNFEDPFGQGKKLEQQSTYELRNLAPTTKFNTNSTDSIVTKFISQVATRGLQQSNRFVVLIHGPNVNYDFFAKPFDRVEQERQKIVQIRKTDVINFKTALTLQMKERLALTCQTASLPSKGIMTQELNAVGNGPAINHAYAENYLPELRLTFLCSADMFERQYFVNWMENIINRGTHEVAMYEKYAQPWSIVVAVLPPDMGKLPRKQRGKGVTFNDVIDSVGGPEKPSEIYFVQYEHVYPFKIAQQELSHAGQNQLLQFDVTFKYHRWFDPIVDYNYNRHVDIVDIAEQPKLSPFEKFKKTARQIADYAKYLDPRELKGAIINEGLGQLNEVVGEGVVESVAQGGQVIDVFVQSNSIEKSVITNPKEYLRTLTGR
jgi:hypothetical protein